MAPMPPTGLVLLAAAATARAANRATARTRATTRWRRWRALPRRWSAARWMRSSRRSWRGRQWTWFVARCWSGRWTWCTRQSARWTTALASSFATRRRSCCGASGCRLETSRRRRTAQGWLRRWPTRRQRRCALPLGGDCWRRARRCSSTCLLRSGSGGARGTAALRDCCGWHVPAALGWGPARRLGCRRWATVWARRRRRWARCLKRSSRQRRPLASAL
mmetsp:Transcript_28549/g.92629  ORF Transcript_28549/g.92629 Transcript_28549/m.92629 type:complete len:220 (-) Transcript_28549:93-752(-)